MSLILTVQLDSESQARFEHLRQRYFPPERNQIPAHLTLFHQLPDSECTLQTIEQISNEHARFGLDVTGLRSLGRGVAYTLASPAIQHLHSRVAAAFSAELIPQDRQRFQPHIVVQNKVASESARTLLSELQRDFVPGTLQAEGLELWRYLNGPWQHLRNFPFRPELL